MAAPNDPTNADLCVLIESFERNIDNTIRGLRHEVNQKLDAIEHSLIGILSAANAGLRSFTTEIPAVGLEFDTCVHGDTDSSSGRF